MLQMDRSFEVADSLGCMVCEFQVKGRYYCQPMLVAPLALGLKFLTNFTGESLGAGGIFGTCLVR